MWRAARATLFASIATALQGGAGDVCVGNGVSRTPIIINGTLRVLHGNDAVGNWTAVQDTNLTAEACQWMFMTEHEIGMHGSKTVLTDGVRQVSDATGNNPSDDVPGSILMGCNLLHQTRTYENFILEATVQNNDNDGVGFVFGWHSIDDHYQAVMVNDDERNPYADGVDAPFIKLKRRDPNLGDCSNHMCFETLSYVDSSGMSNEMQYGNTAAILAKYRGNYTAYSETAASTLYLIVKDREARWGWWDASTQKWMMTWSMLPPEYLGGFVGFITSAQQGALFESVFVTDLDATPDPVMCNGRGSCTDGACACEFGYNQTYKATGTCDASSPSQAPTPSPSIPSEPPAPSPSSNINTPSPVILPFPSPTTAVPTPLPIPARLSRRAIRRCPSPRRPSRRAIRPRCQSPHRCHGQLMKRLRCHRRPRRGAVRARTLE